MDIQKSGVFQDILNSFLDIQKSNNGCPEIELWIFNNQLIFGYPKMYLRISINRCFWISKKKLWISKNEFWISRNRE